MTFLNGLLDKLERPAHAIRAERLQEWARSVGGTVPGAEAQCRSRCNIAGVIQNSRFDPREGSGSIEWTVSDGTRRLVVKWLGRQLSRIRLGLGLILEGAICEGWCNQLQALNTEYQPLPAAETG